MPWRDKMPAMAQNGPEHELLKRLRRATAMNKYDADEAQDIVRAGVEAAARHIETTCPDADFIIIGSVPFGTNRAAGRGPGNAVAQRINGGPLLGASMRGDVIPQQARYFTEANTWWNTFTARLKICWKIMFGKNPEGYGQEDL